jgi:hypothetical protein
MVDDDPVAAWERVLAERGQWREDIPAEGLGTLVTEDRSCGR